MKRPELGHYSPEPTDALLLAQLERIFSKLEANISGHTFLFGYFN
jgi:hypothetical protein